MTIEAKDIITVTRMEPRVKNLLNIVVVVFLAILALVFLLGVLGVDTGAHLRMR